ncbi:MAG: hypothetical protein MUC60_18580 [Oscillatoria sp. Prado101]|nr:hypothetical protein [Oscillatoria sp. Prado101]
MCSQFRKATYCARSFFSQGSKSICAGTLTRTGRVLINSLTIDSAPAIVERRQDLTAPKTTSVSPL